MANSERYLRAVASRSRLASRYAEELAREVTDLSIVKLAREVLDGGEMTYSRATHLAQAILAAGQGAAEVAVRLGDARAVRSTAGVGRRAR